MKPFFVLSQIHREQPAQRRIKQRPTFHFLDLGRIAQEWKMFACVVVEHELDLGIQQPRGSVSRNKHRLTHDLPPLILLAF